MLGRDRVVKTPLARRSVGTADHFEAGRVGRNGKRYGIIFIGFRHIASGQHDHFVGIG